jgi:hypothetical protein
MSEPERGSKFEVPIRFQTSHNIAQPGFQSDRKGEFFSSQGTPLANSPLVLNNLVVLEITVQLLMLKTRNKDWYQLTIELPDPLTMDEFQKWLRQLADAFTASLATTQRDPWYGNLILDVRWSGLRMESPKTNGIAIIGSSHTSIENVVISASILEALQWSPLIAIFVEGMRAPQAKVKFLFWFVIIEELEGREEFRPLFKPLFSDPEKEELLKAKLGDAAKNRLTQLLNDPKVTGEGRARKLLLILQEVGLDKVKALFGEITIDEEICKSLIAQRNHVAHKGKQINEDQLYNILFPLSQGALKYLNNDEA